MAVERIDPRDYADEPLALEHYARYVFAGQFAAGRRVLDIACGTGYGAALLRHLGATAVVGVDAAPEAIEVARSRYASDAVTFVAGDAHEASAVVDGPFGLITSFETLEHLSDPERLVAECARLGSDDLVLVASVPNEPRLSGENPFHVQAFDRERFVALLRRRFEHVAVLPQYFALASAIDNAERSVQPSLRRAEGSLWFAHEVPVEAESFVAVCRTGQAAAQASSGRPATVHGRRFWTYQRQSEQAKSWLDEQRAVWERIAVENEQRLIAEQARVAELLDAQEWLERERASWKQAAEEHLALLEQRDAHIRALEEAKAWLEEQRLAWQRAAEAAAAGGARPPAAAADT